MLQSKDAREDHGDYISSPDSAFSCWLTTKVVKNDCRKISCLERRETISVSADRWLAIHARPLIVVVDEEPHIAITLAEISERRGYFTVWFTEPTAVCAFMETTRPDVLLTDVNMSSLDGLDLACCLRRKHKKCPVMVISATGNDPRLAQRIGALGGFIAMESKPVQIPFLLPRLEELLAQGEGETFAAIRVTHSSEALLG
jgi:CheY-like chemotaxis protein